MFSIKSILFLGLLAIIAVSALDQCTICKHVEERFWAVDRQINGRDRYDACVNFFKYDPADCEFIKVNTACRRACNYNPNRFEMEEELAEEAEDIDEFELTEEDFEDFEDEDEGEAYELDHQSLYPKYYRHSDHSCELILRYRARGKNIHPKLPCYMEKYRENMAKKQMELNQK